MEENKIGGKGLFYMAHPYTAKDADGNYVREAEDANFQLCNYRAGRLMLAGYNVYSPISHTHPIHMATPEFLQRHEHEMWYEVDMNLISKANFDGIILAPGWENSKGCCAEKIVFEHRGLKVLYYKDIIKGD
jgi:hypothetical protein